MGTTDLIKDTLSTLKAELPGATPVAANEIARHQTNVAILKAASEAAGKIAQRFAKAHATLSRVAWSF